MIRQPIISVLGHVDHGKTKFLDRIRGTAIAEKEAGGITQHIGATEVPIETIKKISGNMPEKFGFKLEIPGLLFIDTPGHEAFVNLRKRGGSIADLAVVIVDVTQGFQQQTIEAIEILKNFKTPFVVGLNKIDKLHGYESIEGSFGENIKKQAGGVQRELDERLYITVGKLHGLGLQSERYDRCEDFSKQVAIVPLSAKTGEGLPEMLMLLAGLSQKFLKKKLEIQERELGKGNILEVREEKGLGTTIDVILSDGKLEVNDSIALAGKTGIIKTRIRALLKPKPLEEIRETSEKFVSEKKVFAACGVKISAPKLEQALPGSPVIVLKTGKEVENISTEISGIRIEREETGPIVKADTLGSLEAITQLLEKQLKLKPKRADIGNVTRKDVMEIAGEKETAPFQAVIFAFNVKIDEIAEEEAEKRGQKIIHGNVIYKLIEDFKEWEKIEKEREKEKILSRLSLPAKIQLLPRHIFRNNKPAIVGVRVLKGKIRKGTQLMNENGSLVGTIKSLQLENKEQAEAKAGKEIAISIPEATIGRNLFEEDILYSFIPEKQFREIEEMQECFSEEEKELLKEIKRIVGGKIKQEAVQ